MAKKSKTTDKEQQEQDEKVVPSSDQAQEIHDQQQRESEENQERIQQEEAERQSQQNEEGADSKPKTMKSVHGHEVSVPPQPKGETFNETTRLHTVYAYGAWRQLSESAVRTAMMDSTSGLVLPSGSKFDQKKASSIAGNQ